MKHPNRRTCLALAAATTISLGAAGPALGRPAADRVGAVTGGAIQHEHTVRTEPLRGDTFVCGDLTLRVTRGTMTETNDADLRAGVARVFISRVYRGVRLHGSDGRTYRSSAITAAWFVLHAPDFETPVHGLEVINVMFRGGPDKSPGWLRERISWVDKHETDAVQGPCDFGD
jgi:hypothetical protein